MADFSPAAMEKLAELLRPPEPEVLQGNDLNSTDYEITSNRGKLPPADVAKNTPKNIEEFELQQEKEAEELSFVGGGVTDRKTPEYKMNYQQAVSAEDVFLQIGPKTPSSASCENLIVRIKMPGDKKENVDLAVDTTSVTVTSSQYYLKLPLPHEINPDTSNASWDSSQDTLVLTLKLDREFDFINF
ncbi:dynein axonemal assembly factor 6 [Ostrinia nubilalis]|uniref:dynein axonemal assembly factor 6 n=1 Tax=Ostrinia nubilalis TaxID=29057 RepID=UPI003082446A